MTPRVGAAILAAAVYGCGGGIAKPDPDSSDDWTEILDPAAEDTISDTGSEDVLPEEDAQSPPGPSFAEVGRFDTVIEANGDAAHVYHPAPADLATGGYSFPIALLLQGADVGRQHYSVFATLVASYGFVVVVPDHESIGMAGPGLYAEESEVIDVIAHMTAENGRAGSPVHGVLDTARVVLLGHSYGGACGLTAIGGTCSLPFCVGTFTRPAALAGGAFWGTNLVVPLLGTVPVTDNDSIPLALVQGSLDSMALPADAVSTFDRIVDPPRALVLVEGANHYGICDVLAPPGADPDGSTPTMPLVVSQEIAARWSALFLRAYVLGDAAALEYVLVTGDPGDPDVSVTLVP